MKHKYKDKIIKNFKMAMCCSDAQPCLTLRDLMDCSPSDSSVHGILQVRILQ